MNPDNRPRDPISRAMERERMAGAAIALNERMAGERTPMRDRDPEKWAALLPCEQGGYWTTWNRERREAEVTFCERHPAMHWPCFLCESKMIRAEREAVA